MSKIKEPAWPTEKKHKITEAVTPVTFTVTPDDVKGSVVRCATMCAGARAIKRCLGAETVWIKRTRTVVKYPNGRYYRYMNALLLKRAVGKFDLTAGLFPEGEYKLLKVEHSQSKAEMKKKNKARPDNIDRTNIHKRKRSVLSFR